jgi:hypothetical protein
MPDGILQGIDFARYQRWLDRAVGRDAAFMVFGADGAIAWGHEHEPAAALGKALAGQGSNGDAMHRYPLDPGKTALYRSLGLANAGQIGWAAVVVDRCDEHNAPLSVDHVADTMEDLTTGMVDEYRQKADLESMTEELSARYEELHLVYAIDRQVQAQGGQQEGVFEKLLHSAAEHLSVDIVAFIRPSQNTCLYATNLSKEVHNLDLVLVEMRGDLFRFVQSSGDPLVINAAADPRRAYIFTDMPYKVMACPVQGGRGVEALLVLVNHADKPDFSNSDRKLAEVLATQLASLNNTQLLLEGMREFSQQLATTLIEAVEAKDPYTRGHSDRVHHLSMEIGRALGLPPDELDDLHWGSLLHDVGKIGIPDAVLCKPGKLTKDEYTFIMVHPERSYEILRHVKHLSRAVLGARHHQEMYDGKGYPHGLKGEGIPLHGRIIAVADTYDSITSSRAYRAGRSHEVAMKEIERVSGTQLDPVVVAAFERIVAGEPEWLRRFNIKRDQA